MFCVALLLYSTAECIEELINLDLYWFWRNQQLKNKDFGSSASKKFVNESDEKATALKRCVGQHRIRGGLNEDVMCCKLAYICSQQTQTKRTTSSAVLKQTHWTHSTRWQTSRLCQLNHCFIVQPQVFGRSPSFHILNLRKGHT